MFPQNQRIDLLRRIFECWKNVRYELFSHKGPKRHCGFSSALTGVERCETILEKHAGLASAGNFAHGSKCFRAQYALYRAVSLDHVFSPACDPHLPLPSPNEQIAILVPATSHSCPLFRVVGSSAFSYVAHECTARVKQHGSPSVAILPMPTLGPAGIAISRYGKPVSIPRIASASGGKPRTVVHAASRRLRELSGGDCRSLYLPYREIRDKFRRRIVSKCA